MQVQLTPSGKPEGPVQLFRGAQKLARSGNFAYGVRVRVRPNGAPHAGDSGVADLVRWA